VDQGSKSTVAEQSDAFAGTAKSVHFMKHPNVWRNIGDSTRKSKCDELGQDLTISVKPEAWA